MSDPESDRELVRRFLGDRHEHDFRALYHRHTPALYATAVRLTSDADRAADAVHDSWIRGVEGLPSFGWRSTLRTWLTGILVNRLREMARGDARDRTFTTIEEEDTPSVAPSDFAAAIDVRDAVARLPDGFRTVLVLHDVEGFTHGEIAVMLGIDPGTSKSQLSRARARLRQALIHRDEP